MERLTSTSFIALFRSGGFWVAALAAAVLVFVAVGAPRTAEASSAGGEAVLQDVPVHAAMVQERGPEANLPYLFAVFFVTWAGFFAYVFYSSRRQRQMEREIETLKSALGDRGQTAPDGG